MAESPTVAIEWFEERPVGDIIDDFRAWRRVIDDLQNPIHRALYELLLFTGLRKSAAFTLEWTNVHEGRIHLPMTKNGRTLGENLLVVLLMMLHPTQELEPPANPARFIDVVELLRDKASRQPDWRDHR